MHLGNVYTALLSWLSVRRQGGKWILRIEDLDPQRSKPEHARMIEDDLRWLGLEWDEGGLDDLGPDGPYCQSLRSAFYKDFLERLKATGYTYPCYCTRAEIMATQAPHQSDGRIICRYLSPGPDGPRSGVFGPPQCRRISRANRALWRQGCLHSGGNATVGARPRYSV